MNSIDFSVKGSESLTFSPPHPMKVSFKIADKQPIRLIVTEGAIVEDALETESFYVVGDTLYIVGGITLSVSDETLHVNNGNGTLSVSDGAVVYGG